MSGLIKNILILFLILTIGAWIFTVVRSCKKQEPTVIENPISESDGNNAEDDAIVEDDLYADETDGEGDGEGLGEGDGETDGEGDGSETIGDELDGLDEESDELEDLDEEADEADNNENEAIGNSSVEVTGSNSLSNQPHLVIAGSYLSEVNAKILVNKLKKAGYSDAEVVVFDFSQYHTVCVGRFASESKAHATKRNIIDRALAPEAYVHTKRQRKK